MENSVKRTRTVSPVLLLVFSWAVVLGEPKDDPADLQLAFTFPEI